MATLHTAHKHQRRTAAKSHESASPNGNGVESIGADVETFLGDGLRAAKERAESSMRYVREQTQGARTNAETFIRENPFQAVGIALGVGILAGAAVRSGIFRIAAVAVGEKLASGLFRSGIAGVTGSTAGSN